MVEKPACAAGWWWCPVVRAGCWGRMLLAEAARGRSCALARMLASVLKLVRDHWRVFSIAEVVRCEFKMVAGLRLKDAFGEERRKWKEPIWEEIGVGRACPAGRLCWAMGVAAQEGHWAGLGGWLPACTVGSGVDLPWLVGC